MDIPRPMGSYCHLSSQMAFVKQNDLDKLLKETTNVPGSNSRSRSDRLSPAIDHSSLFSAVFRQTDGPEVVQIARIVRARCDISTTQKRKAGPVADFPEESIKDGASSNFGLRR